MQETTNGRGKRAGREFLVIVESPAKAKTIEKYLGQRYRVLASLGHVRDLPSKKGSVDPAHGFAMHWQSTENAPKVLPPILKASREAQAIYLATDPDREGEAISWHIREVLKEKLGKKFETLQIKRIVFHEITHDAIQDALTRAREKLDEGLIDAYRTRRALDYLVGFSISPLLWRKLPGSRSAGRVQSVALRMICERQTEIDAFAPQEYWSLHARLQTETGEIIQARLVRYQDKRVGKHDIDSEAQAKQIAAAMQECRYSVSLLKKTRTTRTPPPPFTTATLQQDAANALGFSPARTMRIAQKLYEGVMVNATPRALITYMRTDSVVLSSQALAQARAVVSQQFEAKYSLDKPRFYKTRTRNAQEAHEAIRPTDFASLPSALRSSLESDHYRLYELIWRRALASQMARAEIDKSVLEAKEEGGRHGITLRANAAEIVFEGYLTLYGGGRQRADEEREEREGEEGEEGEVSTLPAVREGEELSLEGVKPLRHETQPPPHYGEASLIKALEKEGIGRPSTYAAILNVLKVRGYVVLEGKKLVPQDSGQMTTSFLRHNFTKYVDYAFTATMEDTLDKIAAGESDWHKALAEFWTEFRACVERGDQLSPEQIRAQLSEDLAARFFPDRNGKPASRECPKCKSGRLEVYPSRHGPFVGCANYPECRYTLNTSEHESRQGVEGIEFPHALGVCPETELPVVLRSGPYGLYLQRGEGDNKKKPQRVPLPKQFDPKTLTLQSACQLLSLPREVGVHPEGGEQIFAGIGRFGPYLRHGGKYTSLSEGDDVLTIGINRAVVVIASGGGRVLGDWEGENVVVKKGRFGAYVQHKGQNATLGAGMEEESVTLAEAIELLKQKGKTPRGGFRKRGGKKTAGRARKPSRKKTS